MNRVDLLVAGFVLLHLATFVSVMVWVGRWLALRNASNERYERVKQQERRARIPALTLAVVLAACYVALSILESKLR